MRLKLPDVRIIGYILPLLFGVHHLFSVVPVGSGLVLAGQQRPVDCPAVGDHTQDPGRRHQDLSGGPTVCAGDPEKP